MPGPLSNGVSGHFTVQRHSRCREKARCQGPGCQLYTGKTDGSHVKEYRRVAFNRVRSTRSLLSWENGKGR